MGEVSGYDLHLYCDHPEHTRLVVEWDYPTCYFGRDYMECTRQAKRDGWLLKLRSSIFHFAGGAYRAREGSGVCLCPLHHKMWKEQYGL